MHSSSDPFDFSEYSSSRDGGDNPISDSPWTPAGGGPSSTPGFGAPNQPIPNPGGNLATDLMPARHPSGQSDLVQGRTPLVWVLGSVAVVLVGISAALFTVAGGSIIWAWIGWFLAGPVTAVMLAQHMTADNKERTRPTYDGSKFLQGVYWVAVAFALVGILLGAWQIADWAGRL